MNKSFVYYKDFHFLLYKIYSYTFYKLNSIYICINSVHLKNNLDRYVKILFLHICRGY